LHAFKWNHLLHNSFGFKTSSLCFSVLCVNRVARSRFAVSLQSYLGMGRRRAMPIPVSRDMAVAPCLFQYRATRLSPHAYFSIARRRPMPIQVSRDVAPCLKQTGATQQNVLLFLFQSSLIVSTPFQCSRSRLNNSSALRRLCCLPINH
jgi:hypothetical protein